MLSIETNNSNKIFLIYIAFFISGCSALIFETLWFRVAGVVLGSSVWSAAAVLTSFMLGLGIGNFLAAYFGHRFKNPIMVYVWVELAIGLTAVGSIFWLPTISPYIAHLLSPFLESDGNLYLLRLSIAFITMLIPSVAMGMTLPILQSGIINTEGPYIRSLGRLYGWNTLGAVSGTLLAEFLLIEALGIKNSALLACAFNFFVAFLMVSTFYTRSSAPVPSAQKIKTNLPIKFNPWFFAPFFSGLVLLALEVVWFRYMLLYQNGTSEVFALMLSIVLAGIGIGGLIASRLKTDETRLYRYLCILPIIASAGLIFGFKFFSNTDNAGGFWDFALMAVLLMLPVCIVSGILFPLYGEQIYRRQSVSTASSGILTLANTLGAALGSALATFYLLPTLGIETSLFVLACCYMALGFLTCLLLSFSKFIVSVITVSCALLITNYPHDALERSLTRINNYYLSQYNLVELKESLYGTLQYLEKSSFDETQSFKLVTNGHSMSDTSFFAQRYMKLYVYLPELIHDNIEDVLLISYGVGNTAEAVLDTANLKSLDVVDVSEDILELSTIIHDVNNVYPLKDKRTSVHIEDGRFFLQTSNKKYDLITGEPPPPKNAGIVNLYTQEYFELAYKALKPNGLITYWLPVHALYESDSLSIIKAFCLAFSDCSLWNGGSLNFMLVGSNGGIKPVDEERFDSLLNGKLGTNLKKTGMESFGQLGATLIADNTLLNTLTSNVDAVVDNYPQRISPKTGNLKAYSPVYNDLLDASRRKALLVNSDYVRRIFTSSQIKESVTAVKFDRRLDSLSNRQYYKLENELIWDHLFDTLTGTDLEVLPLLQLGSLPREQEIIAGLTENQRQDPWYYCEYGRGLLAKRQYKAASTSLKQCINSPKYKNDQYFTRLVLISETLDGRPLNNMSLESQTAGEDFVLWLEKKDRESIIP